MKKGIGFLGCVLTLVFIVCACSTPPRIAPVDTATYRDANGKPIKKVPEMEGSFELIQGLAAFPPIDMEKFHKAAYAAFLKHGYRVEKDEEGSILVRLAKSSWWLQLKLCYWTDEYWYEYVNSENLDADPAQDRIHRNYRRWIANLEKAILEYYK
ncbi:MAG: hypothetical protein LBQ57_04555 [Spirochaetales bacterium]|nr:hypothetical protein [Spirochaetales bacterium]